LSSGEDADQGDVVLAAFLEGGVEEFSDGLLGGLGGFEDGLELGVVDMVCEAVGAEDEPVSGEPVEDYLKKQSGDK